jgi:hypothetical protein
MSPEVIATLTSGAMLLVSIIGGFGWMVRRIDAFDARAETRTVLLEEKLTRRMDALEARADQRLSEVDDRLTQVERRLVERIDGIAQELVEVKIAIARLEGPTPRFITAR